LRGAPKSRKRIAKNCGAKPSTAFQMAEFLIDDGEQGLQAFMYGVPNSFVEY